MAARGAREQAARVARFVEAEVAGIPRICGGCLGPNSTVRLVAQPRHKECHSCQRPFVNYVWRPSSDSRPRFLLICRGCSVEKGACQSCLHDLHTGLELGERDTMSADDVARIVQQRRDRTDEEDVAAVARNEALLRRRLQQKRRCAFFAKGHCSRGSSCPFLHAEGETDPKEHSDAAAAIRVTVKTARDASAEEDVPEKLQKRELVHRSTPKTATGPSRAVETPHDEFDFSWME